MRWLSMLGAVAVGALFVFLHGFVAGPRWVRDVADFGYGALVGLGVCWLAWLVDLRRIRRSEQAALLELEMLAAYMHELAVRPPTS